MRVLVWPPAIIIDTWTMHTLHTLVIIQLPRVVCSFQQLNYTLLVEDESGQLVMQHGPEQQQGHNVTILIPLMKQNLPGGRRYSVKVQVGLHSELVTSNKHYFSKPATKWNQSYNVYTMWTIIVAPKEWQNSFPVPSVYYHSIPYPSIDVSARLIACLVHDSKKVSSCFKITTILLSNIQALACTTSVDFLHFRFCCTNFVPFFWMFTSTHKSWRSRS